MKEPGIERVEPNAYGRCPISEQSVERSSGIEAERHLQLLAEGNIGTVAHTPPIGIAGIVRSWTSSMRSPGNAETPISNSGSVAAGSEGSWDGLHLLARPVLCLHGLRAYQPELITEGTNGETSTRFVCRPSSSPGHP